MKKIISLIMFVLILFPFFGETVKIGFFSLEPYAIASGGTEKPTGANVEFWENSLAPKMNVDIEWVGPLPFPRLMTLLKDQELDVVLIAVYNPEREAFSYYPEKPHLLMQSSVTVLKTNKLTSIGSIEDLYGMKLAYLEGATIPPYMINEKITFDNSTVVEYKKANLQKLIRGRIDGIFDLTADTNIYAAKKYNFINDIKVLTLPVEPTKMYSIFVKSEKGKNLVTKYNKVTSQLPANLLQGLVEKY